MMGAYGRDQATVSPNLVVEAAKETFGAQGAPALASVTMVSQATVRGAVIGLLLAAVVAALSCGLADRAPSGR